MAKVVDRDRGYKKLLADIAKLAGREDPHVLIGVRRGTEPPPGQPGLDMVVIAATHEFGTDRAGRGRRTVIPARPYLRTAVDENEDKYTYMLRRIHERLADGRPLQLRRALDLLGLRAKRDVQRKITTLRQPGLAESTKAARARMTKAGTLGGDNANPLVLTGHLRRVIDWETKVR